MKHLFFTSVLAASGVAMTASAHPGHGSHPADRVSVQPMASQTLENTVINSYSRLVKKSYDDALTTAEAMNARVDAFLAAPSQISFDALKASWVKARMVYGLTEAWRFYSGPIDNDEGPEGQLNAWPMDEVYMDYVDGMPNAGIINRPDLYPEITAKLLTSLNELGGEKNIATGYHGIEFLLWGQDTVKGLPSKKSSGQRSFTDYVDAKNADRRGEYLKVLSQLIVSDLKGLVLAWEPAHENYRAKFENMESAEALTNMITGIAELSFAELAGERLFVAIDEGDQEHEQSCFSDMTHLDTEANFLGIYNAWHGSYRQVDYRSPHGKINLPMAKPLPAVTGLTGIKALVAKKDPALAEKVSLQMDKVYNDIRMIPVPFDNSIVEKPALTLNAVQSLRTLGELLQKSGEALGLTIVIGAGD